jgi:hypothetical protein
LAAPLWVFNFGMGFLVEKCYWTTFFSIAEGAGVTIAISQSEFGAVRRYPLPLFMLKVP